MDIAFENHQMDFFKKSKSLFVCLFVCLFGWLFGSNKIFIASH